MGFVVGGGVFFANVTAVLCRENEVIFFIFIIGYNEPISVTCVSADCW